MTNQSQNTFGPLGRFSNDCGSIAIISAIALPILMVVTGVAIDFAAMLRQKSVQQAATDTAAFVAAKEMSLSNAAKVSQAAIVGEIVRAYLANNIPDSERSSDFRFNTTISSNPTEVKIEVNQSPKTFFGNGFGLLSIADHSINRIDELRLGRSSQCD